MTIVCDECEEEFTKRSELFKHIRSCHGDDSKPSSGGPPTTPSTAASSTTKRRGPPKMFQEEPTADIIEPEEVKKKFDWDQLSAYLPLTLSVFWISLGTIFYAVHDDLGWARALFMSVNVGWSINWPMDGLSDIDTPVSKFFTIYHTSGGVLFAGVTVLYMAQEVGKNKDNWILQIIKMKELDATATTEGCWDSIAGLIKVHFPTLRIVAVLFVWLTFGLLWFPFTNTEYPVAKNVDFVLSTLTAMGYVAPPSSIGAYQLIVTALYTNFGVPLLSIALGLLVSLIMESPEDNLIFHQIIEPVTAEEISFMQEFCIENGDGVVDSSEFIILAIVRIGGASPDLIRRINDRFRKLDKKHMGKIAYDDLVVYDQKPAPTPPVEIIAASITEDTHNRRHSLTLSSKASGLMQSSRKLRTRAKSVFEASGSTAASSIRANIAKIESLRKIENQPPASFRSGGGSRRMTASALKTVMDSDSSSDSDSPNDSCGADSDGDDEPTWRKPKRRKSTIYVPPRLSGGDIEESRRSSIQNVRSSTKSDHSKSSRYSSNSSRSNGGGHNSGKFRDHGGDDEPLSWRNSRRRCSSIGSNKVSDDDVECKMSDRFSTRSTTSVSVKFPAECGSRQHSFHCVEEGDEEKDDVDDKSAHSALSSDDEHMVSPLSSQSLSSRKVFPEQFCFASDEDESTEMSMDRVIPLSNHSDFYRGGSDHSDHDDDSLSKWSGKSKFKNLVKKQQQKDIELFTFSEPADEKVIPSEESSMKSSKSKHHYKLQKAKEERRSSKRVVIQNRRKSRWKKMVMNTKNKMKSSYAITFYIWFLWLAAGTIFYCVEENLSFCKGFFVSTSVGYGIFWYDQTSTNNYAKVFLTYHFSIGVFGVACAMAIFARSLISTKKEWFMEAKQKRQLQDGLVTYFDYYWPKVYVHVFFWFWMLLGIVWGMSSMKWSVLDAWLFCMSTMATGGLVSLPSSVHELDYIFVSLYIIIGAPLMAISCGINARSISNYGHSSKMEVKLNAAVTEDELVMMKHLNIEDGDGHIDNAEYTLLMLVRIGALNADLLGVLFDRYAEIDVQGAVTYATLLKGGSFIGSAMLAPFSLRDSFKGNFEDDPSEGSVKESALVKKLRLDSMGGG